MADMIKLFRGTEKEIETAMTEFYNRQGRIGNRVGNAKILVYGNGSIGVSVPYSGDVIDDGRQIDDIEERKTFLLYRTSGTDTTPVDSFVKEHKDAGDDVSRTFITVAGDDTVYFVAAAKVIPHVDPWASSDNDDADDDWTPNGTPTVTPPAAPAIPAATADAEAADVTVDADADDEDPFN